MNIKLITKVDCVLTGKVKEYGPNGQVSGYVKQLRTDVVSLDWEGLSGDAQADKKHHGGIDKALFHYCGDHYKVWRETRPDLSAYLSNIGAFGENISSSGLDEDNVYIGDRFKIGSAIVEVTQGRQPCWKLGHFFDDTTMVKAVIESAKGGWYYRVIERGLIKQGDLIELIERPFPEVSVKQAFDLLIARKKNRAVLEQLTKIPVLAESWKLRAIKFHERLNDDSN